MAAPSNWTTRASPPSIEKGRKLGPTDPGEGEPSARIGPNAVLQLIEALRRAGLEDELGPLLMQAQCPDYLGAPPESLIDEARVLAVYRSLASRLPPASGVSLAGEAGRRTGDYLLAHRIPLAAQRVLRLLPGRLAAPILFTAIARHAWTFAGSAVFAWRGTGGRSIALSLKGGVLLADPAAAPLMRAFYTAVFAHLARALIDEESTVLEKPSETDAILALSLRW